MPQTPLTPELALSQSRRAWGCLMTILALSIAVDAARAGTGAGIKTLLSDPLFWLSPLCGVGVVGLMWYVRSQCYKAGWVGNAITPHGYLKAHAAMSLVALLALAAQAAACAWAGHTWLAGGAPMSVVALVAAALMFPDGKPMSDHPIR